MTRHSKNASAGPTYTYHEKSKDCAQSGYGTVQQRLSKDSVKEFDCCSLTLQPFTNPVITPDGWVFDKEAILEYILAKKLEISKQMKLYEKQRNQKDKDLKELAEIESKSKLEKFLKTEGKLVTSSVSSTPSSTSSVAESATPSSSKSTSSEPTTSQASESVNNMVGEKGKTLPSFWVPSLCPESKTQVPMKKPDSTVYCPMSNKPISMKDLTEIKFKLIDEKLRKDKAAFISTKDRYVCAVSNDILNNSVPCVALKTSGAVVTAEVVEKIIKKDMVDPINGKKMTEKDFIPIQRGGTGFSGAGAKLTAKKVNPSLIS